MRAMFSRPERQRLIFLNLVAWLLLAFCGAAQGQVPDAGAAWYAAPAVDLVFDDAAAASRHAEWHFDRSDAGDIRIQKSERRAGTAISATVISYCDDRALLVGGVVPLAGHPEEELDKPVLALQLTLKLLARAFPQGPAALAGPAVADIDEPHQALRVRLAQRIGQPVREIEAPWRARIQASPADSGAVDFNIVLSHHGGKLQARGRWLPQSRMAVVPPDMDLLGWRVYRIQTLEVEATGNITFQARVQPHPLDFHDLRALRARIERNWSTNPAAYPIARCGGSVAPRPDLSPAPATP